jgi:hypothetical protein
MPGLRRCHAVRADLVVIRGVSGRSSEADPAPPEASSTREAGLPPGETTPAQRRGRGYTGRVSDREQLTVTLDATRAAKLDRLAARAAIERDQLASSMLRAALDEADPDPDRAAELLDGIPGALERARLGLQRAREGHVVPLDDFAGGTG